MQKFHIQFFNGAGEFQYGRLVTKGKADQAWHQAVTAVDGSANLHKAIMTTQQFGQTVTVCSYER